MNKSWRHLCKTSGRRLQNVLKTSWRRLEDVFARRLKDVLKTSWKRLAKTSWRGLEDVLKTSWRRLEDVWPKRIYWSWSRRLEDVLKTSFEDVWVRWIYSSWSRRLEDVFWRRRQKMSSRRLQNVFIKSSVCWVLIKMKNQPQDGFYKKRCLKISLNSQENTCARINSGTGLSSWILPKS